VHFRRLFLGQRRLSSNGIHRCREEYEEAQDFGSAIHHEKNLGDQT
jgi:hypothetical protein